MSQSEEAEVPAGGVEALMPRVGGRSMPLVRAMLTTIRNLFRPMTTTPLPWKGKRPRAERYRATFALVHDEHGDEACIGCKMCEKICPSAIITVIPAGRGVSPNTGKKRGFCKDFTLDLNACLVCELCVQVCPTDAIIMLKEREPVGFSREALVLTMDRLYGNEKRELLAWGRGSVFAEMQNPKRGEPPKPKPVRKAKPAEAANPTEAPKAPEEGS